MTEYFQKNLFKDISMEEYKSLLTCLDGRTRQFRAGDIMCDYDKGFDDIGIIGKGSASVVRYKYGGSRTILERLAPQDIFAICCPVTETDTRESASSATAPVMCFSYTMQPSAPPAPRRAGTITS